VSTAYVCNPLTAGIADLGPAEGTVFRLLRLVVCCVGSGFCEGLITRPEESNCVRSKTSTDGRPGPEVGCSAT